MTPNSSLPTIQVLLADDHRIVRAGIRQFLDQTADIRVTAEAGDGREACEIILHEPPDVAVLDIQMPEMSGIEVARWVRARRLALGILILTAYDDEPYVQGVLKAGANGYVLKTAEPQEIVDAIRGVYQGKTVLDAVLARRLILKMGQEQEQTLTAQLTDRELEVLTLTAKGHTNKAIGMLLRISDRTVQNHLANIFQKLGAESRTQAVMRAVSLGYIPGDIGAKVEE